VTDYFGPETPPRRTRWPRGARAWGSILIVMAVFVGTGAFLESQHNVVATGSQVCNNAACSPSHPAPGHTSPGTSGRASGGRTTNSGGASIVATGAATSTRSGSDAATARSGNVSTGGPLALTGTDVGILVVVAAAMLSVGIVLLRFSRNKVRGP